MKGTHEFHEKWTTTKSTDTTVLVHVNPQYAASKDNFFCHLSAPKYHSNTLSASDGLQICEKTTYSFASYQHKS